MDIQKRELLHNKFAKEGKEYLKRYNVGLFDIAQRVGKTYITVKLLQEFPKNIPICITYPDNQIKESWEKTFKETNFVGSITFCNFDSLHKHIDKHFSFFIIDECHSLNSGTIALETALKIYNNSLYTLGLTGTLNDNSKQLLFNYFGMKTILKYSAEEAIKDEIISDYKIFIHRTKLDNTIRIKDKKGKLETEKQKFDKYTYVIEKLKKENKDFKFLALHRNRLAQTSIGKKNKCLEILKKFKDKRVIVFCGFTKQADDLNIPSFHSKSKNNENIINFNNLKFNHLSLANTGYIGKNYTNLDAVILLSWTGNDEDTFQKISRSMINDYNGKISEIHIICIYEPSELKKLNKALMMLNKDKIKWIETI